MLPRNPLMNLTHCSVPHVRQEFGSGVGTFSDREYLLIYTTAGYSEWRMEGELYMLGPGDCLLLPPHVPHIVKPQGRINQYIAHFTPDDFKGSPSQWPYVIRIGEIDRPKFEALFDLLLKEFRHRLTSSDWVMTGLINSMLAMYARHMDNKAHSVPAITKTWRNVARAIAVMQNKTDSQPTVAELAKHCGLSVSYFCRAFLQQTGYSPHEYFNRIRIQKAKLLLLEPTLNCSEIARQLGFSSIHVSAKSLEDWSDVLPLRMRRIRGRRSY